LTLLFSYPHALRKALFVKRYKRFFVDVLLPNGQEEAVHCPNSGSMKSCLEPNVTAYTLDSFNETRKLRHTLELLELSDGFACLNTGRANEVMEKALRAHVEQGQNEYFPQPLFSQFDRVSREVKFSEHTRFDFCLNSSNSTKKAWIEIKSVSLRLDSGVLSFPDAVTTRGQKHLAELMSAVEQGDEAYLVFVLMRGGNVEARQLASSFRPCHEIDPEYAKMLKNAITCGVKVLIFVPEITIQGFGFRGCFPWPPSASPL
jgi:sugar fermentation stimulation protein A